MSRPGIVGAVLLLGCLSEVTKGGDATLPFRVAWATRISPQATAPVLDGMITAKDGWDAAPTLDSFTFHVPEDISPHEYDDETVAHTEARLLYDDDALYIAMRLDGPGCGHLLAVETRRDGAVKSDDCVEVFIAPPDAPAFDMQTRFEQYYFNFTINSIGTQRDGVGYRNAMWWDGEWSAKTSVRENGWDLEMRIPFATLGVETPTLQSWKLNLCRRYSTPAGARNSHWQPVKHWVLFSWRFGRLIFGEGKPSDQEIDRIYVQRLLEAPLADSSAGLVRVRAELDKVADEVPAKGAVANQLASLSARISDLEERVANIDAEALAGVAVYLTKKYTSRQSPLWGDYEVAARDQLIAEVYTLLADVQSAMRAAEVLRMRCETPAGWPFVVLSGPAITDERFELNKPFPQSFSRADQLSVVACRGEYEPTSFVLYTNETRRDVSVSATDLVGSGGAIPSSAVDIRTIKYWYQAGEWGAQPEVKRAGGILVPELLLKDDGLIVVDTERKRNMMRTQEGLVDISDPTEEFTGEGEPAVDTPKLLGLKPKDAAELQPFDVSADDIKQLIVTVHVPTDSQAGVYEGEIRVDAGEAGSLSLPFLVEVLPFDLAPAPIDYSLYYQGRLVDGESLVPVMSHQKTEVQYRAEMANLLAHGIANPVVQERSLDKFVRMMQIREEVGMPKGHIYNNGLRIDGSEIEQSASLKRFQDTLRPFVEWAKANRYKDYYAYGVDEKDELLPKERPWIEGAHEVGAKIFVAVHDGGEFLDQVGDVLDLPIYYGPVTPRFAQRVHEYGNRMGVYGFPQMNSEKPATFRRNYGILLWQAGYDVAMTYAYQHSFGHAWNDFDFKNAVKDHNFAYPTVDGVIDTLQFEGMREAVDDTRYVATLLAQAKLAMEDPTRRSQAKEAITWIKSVDTQGDLDNLRHDIVARIRDLTN
ncbi:MAG: hypothetical protein IT445_11175 [Phycisphaeraceae bacterium]|nr:hypothetical protein [Phycisphaeraceae bacterium]